MNTPSPPQWQSAIYEGTVRHRRFHPIEHAFRYRLFQMYLDLDELPTLFDGHPLWSARRRAPAWFRRDDHVGDPAKPLARTVRDLVEEHTGRRPRGPIRLLAHLRYFGYVFNPLCVYYCFDEAGERIESLLVDVHNTPWNQRHPYVVDTPVGPATERLRRYRVRKAFHVSPFLGMDYEYDWRFSTPGSRLAIHMRNVRIADDPDEAPIVDFDATLALERREITPASLTWALARYPWMTARIVAAIYFQALRLKSRGAPVHPHPDPNARIGR
ncbi:MAG: DUF1365 domain-containing protein [Myxococcales bacterium]|nr:DUF1365 domain-containing protein [Myxococcales bacterium]